MYTDWTHHIPDYSFADDGFGNMHYTDIDMFWFNVQQLTDSQ